MNEFDYDCCLKKRTAHSASKKANRNKRGCRLPHESMTKKELASMNEIISTVNLTKPMAWEEFKALRPDLQAKYYNGIIDDYGVGSRKIAEMFGVSATAVYKHMKRIGVPFKRTEQRGQLSKERLNKWAGFLAQDDRFVKEKMEEKPKEKAEAEKKEPCGIVGYEITLENIGSWKDLVSLLGSMPLPKGASVTVQVRKAG